VWNADGTLAEGLPERGVDAVSVRGGVRRWRVGGAAEAAGGWQLGDECFVSVEHLAGSSKQ